MKITIDTDELSRLKNESGTIVLEPAAEETLVKILELEKTVEELKNKAKEKLLQEAQKLNPNFSSWHGERVRVTSRAYGAKYYIPDQDFEYAPKELYHTEATVITPNDDYSSILEAIKRSGFEVVKSKTAEGEKNKIERIVNTKEVEAWFKKNRQLPPGITLANRPTVLSFSLKNTNDTQT